MTSETKRASRSVQDIERNAVDEFQLENTTIQSLAWRGISVEKRGWATDARPTPILSEVDGYTEAGTTIHYLIETSAESHQAHSPL